MSSAPASSHASSDPRLRSNAVSVPSGPTYSNGDAAPRGPGAGPGGSVIPHPAANSFAAAHRGGDAGYYSSGYSAVPTGPAYAYSPQPAVSYDPGRTQVYDPVFAGRLATDVADMIRPSIAGIHASSAENTLRSERAATAADRAVRVVSDLRVAVTSQTSAISTALDKHDRASSRIKAAINDDMKRTVAQEFTRNAFATPDTVAARVTGEMDHRFALQRDWLVRIDREARQARNEARFVRELLIEFADRFDAAEFKRSTRKKGAVRSDKLIHAAARAAAPYRHPAVHIGADNSDPIGTLFRRDAEDLAAADLTTQLTGELSPLSPEYELEEGVIVDAPPTASGSGSS